MSSRSIRAIVVDDEELARRGIELRLQSHPDIELIAQCVNGREALTAIDAEQPDLMFLDIQMPGLSGFDVLARVPQESMPMIVFVTAYDRYALDAFEAHALDYLLKPINDARFAQALDRVREHWAQRNALAQREKLMSLLAATRGAGSIDEQTLREQLEPVKEQRYAEILPIRGQLTFLLPQPEIEYMTVGPSSIYMFPRKDGILLGGTHERGDARLEVDSSTTERVLRENRELFEGMG